MIFLAQDGWCAKGAMSSPKWLGSRRDMMRIKAREVNGGQIMEHLVYCVKDFGIYLTGNEEPLECFSQVF